MCPEAIVTEISQRLNDLRAMMPEGIMLLAVSKFQSKEKILGAYEAGQRLFGESRVNELLEKYEALPKDIKWHFIGHLQTNKVRPLIGKGIIIESVDSVRLLQLIDKESEKKNVKTEVLLQVHVAAEETKFGFSPAELEYMMHDISGTSYPHILFRGVMAMATNSDDESTVRKDFVEAASIFRKISRLENVDQNSFNILSMGMSGDWPIAVEEGANLIRIGSAIFGNR